jgi:penicillin amidase
MVATEYGDIGYATCTIMPETTVMKASFTKKGDKPGSVWTKLITSNDLPYVVNPDKGYLVTTNNFVGSERMKYGISLQRTFPTRKVRISEMLEQLIAREGKKIRADDMKKI